MHSSVTRSRWFLEILLVLATLFWGLSYIWVKQVTDSGLSANAFSSMRYTLATLVMLPIAWQELKHSRRVDWKNGLILGAMLYGALFLQSVGMRYTTPANAAFITSAYVVLVPFATWIMMKRKPEKRVLLAVLICIGGLYLLNFQPGERLNLNLGNALMLLCALCWTVQVTYLSVAGKTTGTKLLTVLPLFWAALLSTGVSALTGGFRGAAAAMPKAWLPLVLCVAMPSVACGLLQAYVQKYLPPDRAAVIYTLESVITCGVSVAMGYEGLSLKLAMGGGLIVAAVLLTQLPGADSKKEEKIQPELEVE